MMVSDIKTLIKKRGKISRSEIYSLIEGDKGLIDFALMQLVEKGIIIEVIPEVHCKSCPMKCSLRDEKVYQYI